MLSRSTTCEGMAPGKTRVGLPLASQSKRLLRRGDPRLPGRAARIEGRDPLQRQDHEKRRRADRSQPRFAVDRRFDHRGVSFAHLIENGCGSQCRDIGTLRTNGLSADCRCPPSPIESAVSLPSLRSCVTIAAISPFDCAACGWPGSPAGAPSFGRPAACRLGQFLILLRRFNRRKRLAVLERRVAVGGLRSSPSHCESLAVGSPPAISNTIARAHSPAIALSAVGSSPRRSQRLDGRFTCRRGNGLHPRRQIRVLAEIGEYRVDRNRTTFRYARGMLGLGPTTTGCMLITGESSLSATPGTSICCRSSPPLSISEVLAQ